MLSSFNSWRSSNVRSSRRRAYRRNAIVTMYGFPPEAFPIIATIGYLVDPPATMINASGDTLASMLVTRFVEGKDWMKRNLG